VLFQVSDNGAGGLHSSLELGFGQAEFPAQEQHLPGIVQVYDRGRVILRVELSGDSHAGVFVISGTKVDLANTGQSRFLTVPIVLNGIFSKETRPGGGATDFGA
jgi:hypothetical protein